VLADGALLDIEAAVADACRTGRHDRLRLLGHGEISIVIGWPTDAPTVAAKRLPPFADGAAFERYADVVGRYVARLGDAGVPVLPTEVRGVTRPDGRVAGFHLQPVVPARSLATDVLRAGTPVAHHPVVAGVLRAVAGATGEGVGVDAQLANWAVIDGTPTQLDLTTPFLLDDRGRVAFDMAPFLASLPVPTRPVVGRQMEHLIRRWMTVRGSLLDLVANLYKEHLDAWVDPVLESVNASVDPPMSAGEALRTHRADRRLWPVLLRLQKSQRWWCRRASRTPYEFLLPERTTYED
jgi:hypothetical protein